MDRETINKVVVTDANELFLGLESNGKSMYQYIYREASGVYWDENYHGFKSTPLKEWSHSKWFSHIVSLVKSSLGVELQLSKKATWCNIPEHERKVIVHEHVAI